MKVFTTGQVAKICAVGPGTVVKWFESGRLPGWRVPGSRDRRIAYDDLVTFLLDHGMPLGGLAIKRKLLIVSGDAVLENGVKQCLPGTHVDRAADSFAVAYLIQSLVPTAIVIEASVGLGIVNGVWRGLKKNPTLMSIPVVLIVAEGLAIPAELAGKVEVFYSPFDMQLLATRLRTLTEQVAF